MACVVSTTRTPHTRRLLLGESSFAASKDVKFHIRVYIEETKCRSRFNSSRSQRHKLRLGESGSSTFPKQTSHGRRFMTVRSEAKENPKAQHSTDEMKVTASTSEIEEITDPDAITPSDQQVRLRFDSDTSDRIRSYVRCRQNIGHPCLYLISV